MGLETWIRVRTTFTNGKILEKDIIHMCRYWKVREHLLSIIRHTQSEGGTYKINRSDLEEIRHYFYNLITSEEIEYIESIGRGENTPFIERIGYMIGELEAAFRYTTKQIKYYDYYEDSDDLWMFDPDEVRVDNIEIFLEDSP